MEINGTPFVSGVIIDDYGELRITVPNDPASYVLYNNSIPWKPIDTVGTTLVYNMQSGGEYFLLNKRREIVSQFVNTRTGDFQIKTINTDGADKTPGSVIAYGTYAQQATQKTKLQIMRWVSSVGRDLKPLQMTSENCRISLREAPLDNTWIRFQIDTTSSEPGKPASVYVGDVLVYYIEEIIPY